MNWKINVGDYFEIRQKPFLKNRQSNKNNYLRILYPKLLSFERKVISRKKSGTKFKKKSLQGVVRRS